MKVSVRITESAVDARKFKSMRRFNKALERAIAKEGKRLAGQMSRKIRSNIAPKLSPFTRASRRLAGFRGTKTLVVSGDLAAAPVHVLGEPKTTMFIGIPRGARAKNGRDLVDVAGIHEHGSTIVLAVTPRMRRFIAILMRKARIKPTGRRRRRATGIMVIKIPARPFARPTMLHAQIVTPGKVLEELTRYLKADVPA